jgi:hypothetical protein
MAPFLALACGREVESGSSLDAGNAAEASDAGGAEETGLPPLPGAEVFIALDPSGSVPTTQIETDTQAAFCIATLTTPQAGAVATFTIRKLDGAGGVYSTGKRTLAEAQTQLDYEIPHRDLLPLGPQMTECDGYCARNGADCANGFTNSGLDSCGVGATCCFGPFGPSAFPYPLGSFACDVDVGAEHAGTADFVVVYPPAVDGEVCPRGPVNPDGGASTPAYPEGLCAGWVPDGAKCDGCTCAGEYWSCP